MEVWANRLAFKLREANPKLAPVAVLANGLTYMFMSAFIIGISLAAGLATGHVMETITCLAGFSLLRRFSGGRHLKNIHWCVAFSTLLMVMLAHIPLRDEATILAMNLFSLICVAWFAPTNLRKDVRLKRRELWLMKAMAMGLVCSNFFFENGQAALAFAAQAILLIPTERRETPHE